MGVTGAVLKAEYGKSGPLRLDGEKVQALLSIQITIIRFTHAKGKTTLANRLLGTDWWEDN